MAPPRRSTARGSSATPARSQSPTKRFGRGATAGATDRRAGQSQNPQGPSDIVVDNPQLPDVETEQSFAYGSKKTPLLPEQLVAKGRMTLQQMAETIDVGIAEANQNFEEQAAAAANYGRFSQAAAREYRARRRSESRESSAHPSREPSVESAESAIRTSARTATWASDVATNNQLQDITEESLHYNEGNSPSISGRLGSSDRGSEGPSTFPTGNFEAEYEAERGRRMRPHDAPMGFVMITKDYFRRTSRAILNFPAQVYNLPARLYNSIPRRSNNGAAQNFPRAHNNPAFDSNLMSLKAFIGWTLGMTFFIFCISMTSCIFYTPVPFDADSSSTTLAVLRSFCSRCPRPFSSGDNLVMDNSTWLASFTKSLGIHDQRLRQLESRVESDRSKLSAKLEQLVEKQQTVDAALSNLQHHQSHDSSYSPLIHRVNYCSPGSGAVVDPYLTSPTKQKQFSFLQRMIIGRKYQSHPPSEALRPWNDVGDCWCSSPADGYMQLAVLFGDPIYPEEVVIEHLPSLATPSPITAPREIEIWAASSMVKEKHLNAWGLSEIPREHISEKDFLVQIGSFTYDAATDANHVQTFKLDVNQGTQFFATDKLIFRAVSNYGGEHTCFYRVRAHGVPVLPLPKIIIDGKRIMR